MTVTFLYGKPRAGKGIHMVMTMLHDFQHGRKIFSNMDLNPPFEYTKLDIYDTLNLAAMDMDISPKTLGIQEFSKWFDSHRSNSKENTALTALTGQAGKRELDIIYDDQFANRIPDGIRYVTDYTIICHRDPPHPAEPIMFQYLVFEGFPHVNYHFKYTGRSYTIPAKKIEGFPVYMEQFYTLYNTRQATQSLIMRQHEGGKMNYDLSPELGSKKSKRVKTS